MSPTLSAVILAAGYGKRMKSSLPKVLHPLAGLPMIQHSLRAVAGVTAEPPVVVIGHGADQVRQAAGSQARFAVQSDQLGTAHALLMAAPLLEGKAGLVLVITGDMPLLTSATFARLIELQRANCGPISMLTVILDDPHGFGRVVRGPDGTVREIVEEPQATPEILAIKELNASVYCFDAGWVWDALRRVPLSPKGEYYLTDLAGIAVRDGLEVQALIAEDPNEALGINTRQHLAEAEAVLRQRINLRWMLAGVTIVDPNTTWIETGVEIGPETVLYPGTHLRGQTMIGPDCQIGPNALIANSRLGAGCRVESAWLEDCQLEDGAQAAAFQHLRGAHIRPTGSSQKKKEI